MRKTFGKYLGRFALVNLAAFILFYTSSYILMNDAVEYVRYFIGEAIDFALPVVTAALIAMATARRGCATLIAVAAAIGRLVYLYPAMYLEFVVNQNLNSIDSLLMSIPFSIGFALIELLYSMLLIFLIQLIGCKMAQRHGISFEKAVDCADSPFDFSNEFVMSVFIAGVISFIINFTMEIIDAVTFLTEFGSSYQMGEIIFIAVSFIMILADLLLTQVVTFKVKKEIYKSTSEVKNAKL